MRRVTFSVTGIPQPKGSTKAFVPKGWSRAIVTNDNPKAKGWQQLVTEQAQTVAADGMFLGPVTLAVVFRLPRPTAAPRRVVHHLTKPDIDKLARCALDGLTGVLFPDDRVVVELRARKVYARLPEAPGADIIVADAAPPEPAALALFEDDDTWRS
jgi:Holliday junction resolvase RusA-like endonuclease